MNLGKVVECDRGSNVWSNSRLESMVNAQKGRCRGKKKFYKVRSRRTPAGFFSIPQQGLMFAGCSMHVYWMGCSNNILICVFQPKNTSSFVAKFYESWAMSQNSWQQFFDKQFSILTKFSAYHHQCWKLMTCWHLPGRQPWSCSGWKRLICF